MKYKIGDKVRVKKDLEKGCSYGNNAFVEGMESFKGKIAIITNINKRNEYIIDVDSGFWSWTDEMLEPVADCDFRVDDKVIFKPTEKNKLSGVLTTSGIDTSLGTPYIRLKEHDIWFKPDNFLKVSLFKEGDIVIFRNIEKDRWFSPGPMSKLEGCYGVIEKVNENHYTADKQGEDGCMYKVRNTKTDSMWYVTSASMELVPTMADIETVYYYPKEGIIAATTTAEAIAQAVNNVKPKFKIGDTVVVKSDLIPGKIYDEWGGWHFLPDMAQHMDKIAKVIGYGFSDPNYLRLDVDKGERSWIVNSVLPYIPGSDYDLDRTIITYKQTKQNYENRLQESDPVISGGKERPGCAICYPGSKASIGIGHLRDSTTACKR